MAYGCASPMTLGKELRGQCLSASLLSKITIARLLYECCRVDAWIGIKISRNAFLQIVCGRGRWDGFAARRLSRTASQRRWGSCRGKLKDSGLFFECGATWILCRGDVIEFCDDLGVTGFDWCVVTLFQRASKTKTALIDAHSGANKLSAA